MTTPQEPEDEPVGEELEDDPVSAEDAAWRAIVENYGDRVTLIDPEVEPPAPLPPPDAGLPSEDDLPPDRVEHEQEPGTRDDTEHFVPPVPPPLPTPPPARLLAWMGLFGVPMFVLVALVARLDLPSWFGLLLMAWFVGGFVFLVASMRPGPGQDHDDGARL